MERAAIRIGTLGKPAVLRTGIRGRPCINIMLPLERWTPENGFFLNTTLEAGQAIVMDGQEPLRFPPVGGCLVIMFELR